MLSFSFHLHFSLCACVLLCIYLSIFRPFESRDLSFPGKLFQENRFAFLHGFVFFFFFFLWFFLWFIYILWFAYRGFKIAYRILATQNVIETFRFCIAHFYFNLFLHEKKIYIYILCIDLYSAILFFFFLHTLYIMWTSFSFLDIQSPLDSSINIFSVTLFLFFFLFFSLFLSFSLSRSLFSARILFSSFHSVGGRGRDDWPATEENERIPPNEKKKKINK